MLGLTGDADSGENSGDQIDPDRRSGPAGRRAGQGTRGPYRLQQGLRDDLCGNGYSLDEHWEAEGWWEIKAGDCTQAISGPLQRQYYYIRGEGVGGTMWQGDYYFCTMQTRFRMNDNENCA